MTEGRNNLADLRERIDEIDDAIHDHLMRRSALVEEIAAVKREDGVVMRPGREAQVIRRLLERHGGAFPRGTLVRIWREIISACISQQEQLAVAVYEAEGLRYFERLARAHFGSMTKLAYFSSVSGVMRAISDGKATVGLLPLPGQSEEQPWWRFLARPGSDTPRIIARLPFFRLSDPSSDSAEALVLGMVPHEESGSDHSFLIVDTRTEASRGVLSPLFEKAGLERVEHGVFEDTDDRRLHLIEVRGFLGDEDPRLARLLGTSGDVISHVRVAGAFATPVAGDENGEENGS
jgi:chorismate mutase-like protein